MLQVKAIYDAADKITPSFRRRIREAVPIAMADTSIPECHVDTQEAEGRLLAWLGPLYLRAYQAGADAAAAMVILKARLGSSTYDAKSRPEVLRWIKQRAGATISDWGSTSRKAFRSMMEQALERGMSVSHLSRWIQNKGIGLAERWAKAVESYRARLIADGVPVKRANMLTQRYNDKLVKARADAIAKTETARAAWEGWQAYLKYLVDDEMLSSEAEIEWVTTLDERTCDICGPLDGQRRSLDGVFEGGYEAPPEPHPSCRCGLRLVAPGER
jgi:hypothetical protein